MAVKSAVQVSLHYVSSLQSARLCPTIQYYYNGGWQVHVVRYRDTSPSNIKQPGLK